MPYLTPAATHVSAAEQAYYRGDRESAYQLVRAALLCDPQSIDAWLWLSKLDEDVAHQRECFERVLTLDPSNQLAHEGLETLRLKELLSSFKAPAFAETRRGPLQIVLYLVEDQVITSEQLQEALRQQRLLHQRGEFVQVGDILLRNQWVSPTRLAQALVKQLQDKIHYADGKLSPRFLGEYLVVAGLLTFSQLEAVLAEQMRLRLMGQRVALGNVLLRKKLVSQATLTRILEQQRAEFYHRLRD